jgi:uncharacterized protein (TIGR02145 family)
MRIFSILILLFIPTQKLFSQDYQIRFEGAGASTSVSSVRVDNLTQGTTLTMPGDQILHLMKDITGIQSASRQEINSIRFYPNPMDHYTRMEFDVPEACTSQIEISDLSGRIVAATRGVVQPGLQLYKITGLPGGMYVVKIKAGHYQYTGKLVSNYTSGHAAQIVFQESLAQNNRPLKNASSEIRMQFNDGDRLLFTGTQDKYTTVVVDVPSQNKTIPFRFVACTDADGNHYPVVQIGDHLWMAENLKTTSYNNGDLIPLITDNSQWQSAASGAYCPYENNAALAEDYGMLYNWYAITDSRTIAPPGWKIPDFDESIAFAKSLVGDKAVGGLLKETGLTRWIAPNTGASNATGFTAVPGGIRWVNGSFSSLGYYGYWWCPSDNDETHSYAFGLNNASDSLKFYIGEKNYGLSVRCLKEESGPDFTSLTTGPVREAVSETLSPQGGEIVVPALNSPIDGLKITVNPNSFVSDQTFHVSYCEITDHAFGEFFHPVSPLIAVSYNGGYANELMTVEVPVDIPEGYFAMGFLYNKNTGELEGMPLLTLTRHSVTVATRHFATSSVSGPHTKSSLQNKNLYEAVTDSGYFVVSAISLEELKKQTDLVFDFEPGHDDWEFTNHGSCLSSDGICSGMCLSAMWYFIEERLNGNTQLFHKYDKATIINASTLWQDNPEGIKLGSMVQVDYQKTYKAYESAVDQIARDKTKDSLSWYAFAYSILQTKQPQFIGIMSSAGGGHVLIANSVWMQNGEIWISDPNHPGNRNISLYYDDNEFEPYYASLDASTNSYNFEYIAYYGKTAVVDWNTVGKRWEEVNNGTIGDDLFPDKKLWVYDPSGKTAGWELTQDFNTSLDSLYLTIKDNGWKDYAFAVFDAEGYKIYPKDPYLYGYGDWIQLNPGLNILGYCIYKRSYDQDNKERWDWADFKWVDIYRRELEIKPNPAITCMIDEEVKFSASTGGTAPMNVKYIWNFGDGTGEHEVYNDTLITHTFNKGGTFDVSVIQYNTLTGDTTGTAWAKAKIGFNHFGLVIEDLLVTSSCSMQDTTFNEEVPTYIEFFLSAVDKYQTTWEDANTFEATWDGIHTYSPDFLHTYHVPCKGSARFSFYPNDKLHFEIIYEVENYGYTIDGTLPFTNQSSNTYTYGSMKDIATYHPIEHLTYRYNYSDYYGQGEKACQAIEFKDDWLRIVISLTTQ